MRKSSTATSTAAAPEIDETASLLNANHPTTEKMMRGSISGEGEEEDSSKSPSFSSSGWFPFASKLVGVKVLVLIAVVFYCATVMTTTTTTETTPRMTGKGKKGELETLKHFLDDTVFKNARVLFLRKRGGEMEINGDGALLISTASSKPSSSSSLLGEDDARGRTLRTTSGAATTTAKKKKEEGSEEEKRRRKEKEKKEREEKEEEEEEALEELLVGVHDQVYGKKHLIDKSILRKREGKELPIFIHIPKAGGTSVEAMVANVGARIGSCNSRETNGASNEAARPYEVHPAWDVGKAEDFHSPPKVAKGKTYLENSFTTVRNPYSRAESEYFWYLLRKYPKEYELLQSSTDNWQTYVNNEGKVYYYNEVLNRATFDEPKPSWMSCEKFGVWLKDSSEFVLKNNLLECYRLGKYSEGSIAACDETLSRANGGKGPTESDGSSMIIGKDRTHHVPQYVLGRTAERVFSIEDCFDDKEGFCTDVRTKSSNTDAVMQPNLISYLREKFSPKITPEVVNSISGNKDLNKATLSQCWRNGNMPSETISNFLKAYDVDFEKYRYSKELPGGKEKSAVLTSSSSSSTSEAEMGHDEEEEKSLKKMSSSWEKAQKNRFEKEDELKSLAEARKQELEKQAKLAKKQDEEIEKLTRMSSELADAKIQAEIELEETQKQIAEARLKRSKRIVKRRRSNRKLLGGNNVEIPRAATLEAYDEEDLPDREGGGRLGVVVEDKKEDKEEIEREQGDASVLDLDHDEPTNRKMLFCAGGLRVPRVHVEKDSEVGWAVWNTNKELRDEMIERGELAT